MTFIQLAEIEKIFNGKNGPVKALDHINLAIEKGEIFGIIGYSGAGKSTLIRLLNGLEKPSSGSVKIGDQEVTQLSGKDLRLFRKKTGMVFQHFNLLWSRTVWENIALPLELNGYSKKQAQAKTKELIYLVGLEGRENAYPTQLSGGQKQRVGIARALANDPEILLCDEATSALDPQTTDEVLELLVDINQKLGLTIVLITHEMQVIRKICHHVAVMEKGRVVECGRVLDVFQRPQAQVTKKFVQQETLPAEFQQEDSFTYLINKYPEGWLIQLTFKEGQAQQPVISQAVKACQVDVNVLQGQIQQTQASSFGVLLVQLLGTNEQLEATLEFLHEREINVEVIHRG